MTALRERVGAHVTAYVHVNEDTFVESEIKDSDGRPYVVVTIGESPTARLHLFLNEAAIDHMHEVVIRAREGMYAAQGLLPSGEPCQYVDRFGSWEWNEHDHDACLEQLVDEPIPFVPTESAPELGTAWERHDDPTVEDNPLDDDDWDGDEDDEADDRDDDMHLSPGQRVLRAEGWL